MRKLLSAVLLLCAACPGPKPAEEPVATPTVPTLAPDEPTAPKPDAVSAQYRGYVAMNEVIRSRVSTSPTFELAFYLGSRGFSLTPLLGQWDGQGIRNSFRNGKPNAMSFLIWRTAFEGLGKDLAANCPGQPPLPVGSLLKPRPEVTALLAKLCTWPSAEARSEETLNEAWRLFARYDAPDDERTAWRESFQSAAYDSASVEEVLSDLSVTVFMNPYVLLDN
ncbi:MAG: hypothetical protein ACT4TC_11985 [Myxococcaceae bacterium]